MKKIQVCMISLIKINGGALYMSFIFSRIWPIWKKLFWRAIKTSRFVYPRKPFLHIWFTSVRRLKGISIWEDVRTDERTRWAKADEKTRKNDCSPIAVLRKIMKFWVFMIWYDNSFLFINFLGLNKWNLRYVKFFHELNDHNFDFEN